LIVGCYKSADGKHPEPDAWSEARRRDRVRFVVQTLEKGLRSGVEDVKPEIALAFQYTNRRGDIYHLQAKNRKNGSIGYSFARKLTGKPVDGLPDGFEAYELPDNAQVVLRKIKPTRILPIEQERLEQSVRRLAKSVNFLVEVQGDSLIVYTADTDADEAIRNLSAIIPMSAEVVRDHRDWITRNARYSKMFRFTLTDPDSRDFFAERWCFLGSIDDWFCLSGGKLQSLILKYVPHLGKESFFELMS
jgi:hypothetical protein